MTVAHAGARPRRHLHGGPGSTAAERNELMKNVNEIMAERAAAAGIDLNNAPDEAKATVPLIAQALDAILPTLEELPESLEIVAMALRSYADVADEYAAAQ
jgi:hypothetical protein